MGAHKRVGTQVSENAAGKPFPTITTESVVTPNTRPDSHEKSSAASTPDVFACSSDDIDESAGLADLYRGRDPEDPQTHKELGSSGA